MIPWPVKTPTITDMKLKPANTAKDGPGYNISPYADLTKKITAVARYPEKRRKLKVNDFAQNNLNSK